MTEQKHTPEPWRADIPSWRFIRAKDGNLIAMCESNKGEANGRRIVACINACAGLATEYLEAVGLPEFAGKQLCADMVQQELDAVTAQRDRLRAALERAADALEREEKLWPWANEARAALDATE